LRSDVALRCDDVVKTYPTAAGEVRALRGVTASFRRGTVSAVVGPTGSGKSSLLRLLCGLDRPTSGSILVGDLPVHRATSRTLRGLRRRVVGYVFQRPSDNFLPYLTVNEHLIRAVRGAPAGAPEPAAVLDRIEIGHRLHHLPEELSGGEQQRAAIAQLLVSGASIILSDEPTAELDEASGQGLLDAIGGMRDTTFVLATHDPSVWRRAGEVVELDHGRLRMTTRATRLERDLGSSMARVEDPDPPSPLVELRGVSKRYARGGEVVRAVRDATLSVRTSECLALVGRSGSGKTTLLNLVAGWEQPDGGEIEWALPTAEAPLPWNVVAIVPQHLGLVDELTIRENVEYPVRLSGRLEEASARIEELMDSLGLIPLENRSPGETSVGEQQRTALARALVLSPRLVLADEPTGHQDEGWTKAVVGALRAASADGTACLVATHDPEVIRRSDRVVTMADGRIGSSVADPGLSRLQ
jgi:putative ABC transport system ATP-binding protein